MNNKKSILSIIILLCFTLVISACGNSNDNQTNSNANNGEKKIIISCKLPTEQYILAELMTELIQNNTDIKVEQKLGLGATAVVHPAMVKGDIDIYPEYTNAGWLQVLKNQSFTGNDDELFKQLNEQYKEKYNIVWLDQFGFNDSYSLTVRKDFANEKGIKTFSDLAAISNQLTFVANPDFYEIEGGMRLIKEKYGFDFKNTKDIDVNLKYKILNDKQADASVAFTTDGEIKKYDLLVLEDDKNVFPTYYAAPVIRQETLEKHPELKDVLNKLKISEQEMIDMNYEVIENKKEAKDVAKEFLKSKNLIK